LTLKNKQSMDGGKVVLQGVPFSFMGITWSQDHGFKYWPIPICIGSIVLVLR